ncbi:stationary phase survival protein SurE [Pedobacter sp. NJ-S-72]
MIKNIKNDVWVGFGIGVFLPGVLLSIVWFVMHQIAYLAKADLLLIGCIAVNALLLKYFFKVNKENTGRGVLGATFMGPAFLFL